MNNEIEVVFKTNDYGVSFKNPNIIINNYTIKTATFPLLLNFSQGQQEMGPCFENNLVQSVFRRIKKWKRLESEELVGLSCI